ncbi:hypothetical protein KS2013_573 [Kangiella sediminilitoris]|uniref:AB hydrolase-1 domain-containing protein n=2 Tax=Kangiella sediminilitoris TaxID=1144748 RepID=A0A1B3B917_9GAMM|nr:hypothetical protein KS2013_573 [Kangiella sediminilitoris]
MSSAQSNIENKVDLKGNTKQSNHPVAKALHIFFKAGDRFFVNKAGEIASNLWFKPRKFKISTHERNIVEQAEIASFSLSQNKQVTYYRWGKSKKTILLVHGWEGRASQFYKMIQHLIKNDYSVISFDAPGHGSSQGKDSDIIEFHQIMLHLQKIFGSFDGVIAHSFGAICASYSINNGLESDKIVTISTPSHFKGLVYKFQVILGLTDNVTDRLCKNIESRFSEHHGDIWQNFSAYVNARRASAKALIVHDKNDKEVPYEESVLIDENWTDSQLLLTEGLGHKRILKDEATINSITEFLANTQASETMLN